MFALLTLFLAQVGYSLGLPENVLVVQNGNSQVSMNVAAHYMAARRVPVGNLVTITASDSSVSRAAESILPDDYRSQIEQPIRDFLSANNLTSKIQYIVLTRGVPLVLTEGQSVDSMLASMDLVDPLVVEFTDQNNNVIGSADANRYWRSSKPFTHSEFGGYLVTRLDGYTEADAEALVDRALAQPATPAYFLFDADSERGLGNPALQPKWYLLPDGSFDPNYQLNYDDYNGDIAKASQVITGRPGISTTLDQTNTFVGSPNPLTGYVSWGSNDWRYNPSVYHSLTFGPRGIAETAVSTSARTMFSDPAGQSQIPDLIAQGAAGAKGYVTEPFLDAIASPTVLFDLYTSGRNLAESYYAASRFLRWKDVVLGDPLCCLEGTNTATVTTAKSLPDGTLITIAGKSVSAGTDDFSDRFYIEESDRSGGIMVYLGASFPGILRDSTVTVRGILGTLNGERAILNASVVGPSSTMGAFSMRVSSPGITLRRRIPGRRIGGK